MTFIAGCIDFEVEAVL